MEKTAKPVAAGVLIIITGVFGLMFALSAFLAFFAVTISLDIYIPFFPEFVSAVLLTLGIISCLFSLFILVGGICALQRKYWGLALAGSIVAVLGFPLLGIPALVLVALSREEFERAPA